MTVEYIAVRSVDDIPRAVELVQRLKPDSWIEHSDPGSIAILLKRQESRRSHRTIGRIRVFDDGGRGSTLSDLLDRAMRKAMGWSELDEA